VCGRGEGYAVFWWGVEGKRTLGRPRRRRQTNITKDLQEINWGTWAGLIWLWTGASSGLVNTTMDFWVPLNAENVLDRLRNCQLH